MTRAARSVFVFGVYIVIVGSALLAFPNTLLEISGIEPAADVWVRVSGMLITILGLYYVLCARQELTYFFQLTVYGRATPIVMFSIFAATGEAEWRLVLFGIADLAGATWTALELRSRRRQGLAPVARNYELNSQGGST